ncbi:hypothetical protein SAMN04488009_1138 [Maribacter sedimenticola]|uniref:Uncharacterized protein n=1 Tax=Maribacter sedimenticola TaxID=228956 RepID=A0ABY1SEB4_9FLAO|nr:hypothetical protein SAMN04488009_1138 [Maribacter sedimenticola]
MLDSNYNLIYSYILLKILVYVQKTIKMKQKKLGRNLKNLGIRSFVIYLASF